MLGDPIEHSRSPVIHLAAMRHLGIEGSYEALKAGPAELAAAAREMRDGILHGINVTMPLKTEAARTADRLTAEAARSGSVNTMRHVDGVLEGHSTDVIAATKALDDERFSDGSAVLILGSGGAAAAVLVGAEGRMVYVSARDQSRARGLIQRVGAKAETVPFGVAVAGALMINATPLGMAGERLPEAVVAAAGGIIDLVYGDQVTPAVSDAARAGIPVMDGVEFLVLQAAASFEWWTGRPAPVEVMLEAARKA